MIPNNTKNFSPHSNGSNKPELPNAGVYEAVIEGAKVEETPWGGHRLILFMDITEGEYKGRYKELFDWEKKNSNYTPKWKGTLRQNVPTGDGSEKDGWTQRSFEGMVWAIEQSNPGYTFDWNEQSLKGKAIGINVRNKEWEFNDLSGWTTEIARLESIEEVRAGRVKVAKDKPLNNSNQTAAAAAPEAQNGGFTAVETDELPF